MSADHQEFIRSLITEYQTGLTTRMGHLAEQGIDTEQQHEVIGGLVRLYEQVPKDYAPATVTTYHTETGLTGHLTAPLKRRLARNRLMELGGLTLRDQEVPEQQVSKDKAETQVHLHLLADADAQMASNMLLLDAQGEALLAAATVTLEQLRTALPGEPIRSLTPHVYVLHETVQGERIITLPNTANPVSLLREFGTLVQSTTQLRNDTTRAGYNDHDRKRNFGLLRERVRQSRTPGQTDLFVYITPSLHYRPDLAYAGIKDMAPCIWDCSSPYRYGVEPRITVIPAKK